MYVVGTHLNCINKEQPHFHDELEKIIPKLTANTHVVGKSWIRQALWNALSMMQCKAVLGKSALWCYVTVLGLACKKKKNFYFGSSAKIWSAFPFKYVLTLLHSERPKLHTILAFLGAVGLSEGNVTVQCTAIEKQFLKAQSLFDICRSLQSTTL